MSDVPDHQVPRRLFVAWRNPDSRQIIPVGLLLQSNESGAPGYTFVYLKIAETLEGFHPLPGLPDLHRRYDSRSLFPVFANRIMPRERPDYPEYLSGLDLAPDSDPFEVLQRSAGARVTDRIEVFAAPQRTSSGEASSLFFVRGIRRLPGALDAVNEIRTGDHLTLIDEPDNQVNGHAMLLAGPREVPIGWVPDYLVDHLHDLRDLNDADPVVTVEHVNGVDVAPHMRVLCRLTARWPVAYEPFDAIDLQPAVSLSS